MEVAGFLATKLVVGGLRQQVVHVVLDARRTRAIELRVDREAHFACVLDEEREGAVNLVVAAQLENGLGRLHRLWVEHPLVEVRRLIEEGLDGEEVGRQEAIDDIFVDSTRGKA